MTVISRTIRSIPYRSAADTWKFIIDLLAPSSGPARTELESIAGTVCSLIAEEQMGNYPIVVTGSGPRIKVYCLYNDDAIEGDKSAESPLASATTRGDWRSSLPSPEADLAWVQKALKAKSSRITARKQEEGIDEEADTSEINAAALNVNMEALKKL